MNKCQWPKVGKAEQVCNRPCVGQWCSKHNYYSQHKESPGMPKKCLCGNYTKSKFGICAACQKTPKHRSDLVKLGQEALVQGLQLDITKKLTKLLAPLATTDQSADNNLGQIVGKLLPYTVDPEDESLLRVAQTTNVNIYPEPFKIAAEAAKKLRVAYISLPPDRKDKDLNQAITELEGYAKTRSLDKAKKMISKGQADQVLTA